MRKLFLLLLISYQVAAQTPKKISEYTPVSSLAGTEETIVNQGGVTRKATVDQIRTGLVPLSFKTGLDALNGIIKSNGSGGYSSITDNSSNWNTAFGWGNHAGLYRPISYVPSWADITGKPDLDKQSRWANVTAVSDTHIDVADDGISVIDGNTVTAGLWFLFINQNDPAQNGIYVAPSAGNDWVRAPGFNTSADFQHGVYVAAISDLGVYANKTFWFKNQPSVGLVLDQYPAPVENPENDLDAGYYNTDFMDFYANAPIKPGSIVITGSTVTATDNGAGVLTGAGVVSGTVNYATGYIELTTSTLQDDFFVDYIWLTQDPGDYPIEFNEVFSFQHSSNSTSHTVSLGGSQFSLKEGSNILLTTSGSEVTIDASIPSFPVTWNPSYSSWEVNNNFLSLGSISAGSYYFDYANYYWGAAFHARTSDSESSRQSIVNPMVKLYNQHFTMTNGYGGSIDIGFSDGQESRIKWYLTDLPSTVRQNLAFDVYDGSSHWTSFNANSETKKVELRGLTVKESADPTKQADFNLAGITTGTTRTFTLPNASGTVALTSDIPTAFTDEQAQDAVGAMVDGSLIYVDGTPLLQRSALTGAITASAGSNTTALGSFTSNALSSAISDRARTVTSTDAIVQADNGRTIYFNSASPFNFTIDQLTINSDAAFINLGAGEVTFVNGTGVTIQGATTLAAASAPDFPTAYIVYQSATSPIIMAAGGGGGGGDMLESVYDPANISEQVVGVNATQNIWNKTYNGVDLSIDGDGDLVLRDDGTYGPIPVTRKNALVVEADFYTDTSPYAPSLVGAAISGGTDNVIAGEANHPGIIDMRDGTTANGGWYIQTAANAFLLAGGEKMVVTFQIRNARSTANGWIGFKDNTTNAQPTDGAYVYFVGNGTTVTMDARTRSNSTETINGTTWVPTLNTWYTLVIELNAGGTQVNFEVFNDSGTSQWAVNNTTNIPTGAGRQTGVGVQVNESTTDAAAAIMYLDYLRFEINRTLTR